MQASRGAKAAQQGRPCPNCSQVVPHCQGHSAPDTGASLAPSGYGLLSAAGEVVCSAPALHGVASTHLRSLWLLREFPLFRGIFSCVLLCVACIEEGRVPLVSLTPDSNDRNTRASRELSSQCCCPKAQITNLSPKQCLLQGNFPSFASGKQQVL